jgi:hypothetical protein
MNAFIKLSKYICPILLCITLIFLTGCDDEEDAKDFLKKEITLVEKANKAHEKIISDKDALLYQAQILNARTKGLISQQLANAALSTLQVQSSLFPPLKQEDILKVNKDVSSATNVPTYNNILKSDLYTSNLLLKQLSIDLENYSQSQTNLITEINYAGDFTLGLAKITDEDKSYLGFGRFIFGLHDSLKRMFYIIGGLALILFVSSIVLSVYPPTVPIGVSLFSGTKLGFEIFGKLLYYIIIWPILTLFKVIINNLTTATTSQTK